MRKVLQDRLCKVLDNVSDRKIEEVIDIITRETTIVPETLPEELNSNKYKCYMMMVIRDGDMLRNVPTMFHTQEMYERALINSWRAVTYMINPSVELIRKACQWQSFIGYAKLKEIDFHIPNDIKLIVTDRFENTKLHSYYVKKVLEDFSYYEKYIPQELKINDRFLKHLINYEDAIDVLNLIYKPSKSIIKYACKLCNYELLYEIEMETKVFNKALLKELLEDEKDNPENIHKIFKEISCDIDNLKYYYKYNLDDDYIKEYIADCVDCLFYKMNDDKISGSKAIRKMEHLLNRVPEKYFEDEYFIKSVVSVYPRVLNRVKDVNKIDYDIVDSINTDIDLVENVFSVELATNIDKRILEYIMNKYPELIIVELMPTKGSELYKYVKDHAVEILTENYTLISNSIFLMDEEIVDFALNLNHQAILYIPHPTEKQLEKALDREPRLINYINQEYLTEEIILKYLKLTPSLWIGLRNKTLKWRADVKDMVCELRPHLIQYLDKTNPVDKIIIEKALEKDPNNKRYIEEKSYFMELGNTNIHTTGLGKTITSLKMMENKGLV